jgi:hypothetical protein
MAFTRRMLKIYKTILFTAGATSHSTNLAIIKRVPLPYKHLKIDFRVENGVFFENSDGKTF